ncbi:hypothetical protein SISSUDRAFT_1040054 [Sistotremastrum suecicum HHB10207 ss-3]|uniref:DUF6699 domain-containing protein n=1 Tax=Sistotremastrum suecicum HHB10207 ss-3 TaxID=1314776 RepID=A0A166IBK0_9AGAM|nr:hypothetical protein SISSUDRAFT_1040054 [Sistotremastrum suecicum HHB10207 ss-3]
MHYETAYSPRSGAPSPALSGYRTGNSTSYFLPRTQNYMPSQQYGYGNYYSPSSPGMIYSAGSGRGGYSGFPSHSYGEDQYSRSPESSGHDGYDGNYLRPEVHRPRFIRDRRGRSPRQADIDSLRDGFEAEPSAVEGLHPALWPNSDLQFDLYYQPPDSERARDGPAVGNATVIRIVSDDFPWSIDASNEAASPLTHRDVMQSLYAFFQEDLTDLEFLSASESRKAKITKAWEAREVDSPSDEPEGDTLAKRIDWLGKRTRFDGLTKLDTSRMAAPLLPGRKPCAETWILRLRNRDE